MALNDVLSSNEMGCWGVNNYFFLPVHVVVVPARIVFNLDAFLGYRMDCARDVQVVSITELTARVRCS